MSVLTVGLSHRSSPVALIERVAMTPEERDDYLTELVAGPAIGEAMMLGTCNRLEIYTEVDGFHRGVAAVAELLSHHTGVPGDELARHLYVHHDERAVQHLFAVSCGLDSMVVGEGQILGQVREAFKAAQDLGTVGRSLYDLGQRALRVGKRAHTETHLDQAGADMVSAGLLLAVRHLRGTPAADCGTTPPPATGADGAACPVSGAPDITAEVTASLPEPQPLTGRRVLVLGAGSMSALAANTVARQGASVVLVANRTTERAARVAECLTEAYTGITSRALELADAATVLAEVDLVVSCTGAQGHVLTAADVASRLRNTTAPATTPNGGASLVFLDLALPHDIDPAVRDLPDVALVDLETMRRAAGSDDSRPGGATPESPVIGRVRDIVAEEVAEYHSGRRADQVTPTVVALRDKASAVVAAELERLHGRLPDLDDRSRAEVGRALRRVADKLLHQPTVRVKQLASAPGGGSYEAALRELFDLTPAIDPEASPPATDEEEIAS